MEFRRYPTIQRAYPGLRFVSSGLRSSESQSSNPEAWRKSPATLPPQTVIKFLDSPSPNTRGVSRASRGAGRAAVAFVGRLTPVPRRRPKPHGPGAPFRAPLGFHWRRRRAWSERRPSVVWSPRAVDSNGQSTGGHAEQAYKHRARDAGQTGKACGDYRLCALPTLHTGLRGLRPRRSARPRSCEGRPLRGKTLRKTSGAPAPRERCCLTFAPLCNGVPASWNSRTLSRSLAAATASGALPPMFARRTARGLTAEGVAGNVSRVGIDRTIAADAADFDPTLLHG